MLAATWYAIYLLRSTFKAIRIMEKIIIYFGHQAKISCDEKCNKAWGWNHRPFIQLSDEEDDI